MARHDYTATGGQTVFTYTFQIFEDSEIQVYQNDVLLTLTTDYTVSNLALPSIGGSITLVNPAGVGGAIALVQDVPFSRLIDYQTDGDWEATVVNSDFDRIYTLFTQQFENGGGASDTLSDRLLKFSDGQDRSGNTNLIPSPDVGKVLSWGPTGDIENIDAIPTVNAGSQVVANNVTDLRAADPTSSISAFLNGNAVANDGLQASYYFDAASTAADNGFTIIKPNSIDSLDPGRWLFLSLGGDSVGPFQIQDDAVGEEQVGTGQITDEKRPQIPESTVSGRAVGAGTGVRSPLTNNEVAAIVLSAESGIEESRTIIVEADLAGFSSENVTVPISEFENPLGGGWYEYDFTLKMRMYTDVAIGVSMRQTSGFALDGHVSNFEIVDVGVVGPYRWAGTKGGSFIKTTIVTITTTGGVLKTIQVKGFLNSTTAGVPAVNFAGGPSDNMILQQGSYIKWTKIKDPTLES